MEVGDDGWLKLNGPLVSDKDILYFNMFKYNKLYCGNNWNLRK